MAAAPTRAVPKGGDRGMQAINGAMPYNADRTRVGSRPVAISAAITSASQQAAASGHADARASLLAHVARVPQSHAM